MCQEPFLSILKVHFKEDGDCMDSEILVLDEGMERIREMVVESCQDIAAGKGREDY